MTIYIESFLIQNILINFCLLRLVYLTTKSKTSTFKLVLSAIVGAIFSVVCAYLLTSNLIMNAIKLITSIAMIIIAFNVNFKQFLFNFILLFAYTYAVFGAIIALSSASYFTSFGVVTASKINLNLIAILVIVFSYIFELVCKHIKFKIKSNNLIYPITLIDNGNKVKIDAYLDTGNLLNVAGEPVIVVDFGTATTFDIVNRNGEFIGGVIAPGLSLQMKVLNKFTSKLPRIDVAISNNAIGHNTADAILSGVIRGSACMIDGLVKQCEKELG